MNRVEDASGETLDSRWICEGLIQIDVVAAAVQAAMQSAVEVAIAPFKAGLQSPAKFARIDPKTCKAWIHRVDSLGS